MRDPLFDHPWTRIGLIIVASTALQGSVVAAPAGYGEPYEEPGVVQKVSSFFHRLFTKEEHPSQRHVPPPSPYYKYDYGTQPSSRTSYSLDTPPREPWQGNTYLAEVRPKESVTPASERKARASRIPEPAKHVRADEPPTAIEKPEKRKYEPKADTTPSFASNTPKKPLGTSKPTNTEPRPSVTISSETPAEDIYGHKPEPEPKTEPKPRQEVRNTTPPPQDTPPSPRPSSPTPPPAKPPVSENKEILTATKTANPDRVKSPYAPFSELDVGGLSKGSSALDPTTQRVFRVP